MNTRRCYLLFILAYASVFHYTRFFLMAAVIVVVFIFIWSSRIAVSMIALLSNPFGFQQWIRHTGPSIIIDRHFIYLTRLNLARLSVRTIKTGQDALIVTRIRLNNQFQKKTKLINFESVPIASIFFFSFLSFRCHIDSLYFHSYSIRTPLLMRCYSIFNVNLSMLGRILYFKFVISNPRFHHERNTISPCTLFFVRSIRPFCFVCFWRKWNPAISLCHYIKDCKQKNIII